jgi:hypothetical protein
MAVAKRPEEATLLDVLIDGFEKNEVLDGFHERVLPLGDEQLAKARFAALLEEVIRWKGSPMRRDEQAEWQLAAWSDLELLQAGSALAIRIRAPRFSAWWHEPATWRGDPMQRASEAWEEADAAARSHGQAGHTPI